MRPTAAGSRRPPSLPGTRAARGHRTRCSGLEDRRVRRVHQDRLGWCCGAVARPGVEPRSSGLRVRRSTFPSLTGVAVCVDLGGIEPPTSALPRRRATDCATGPSWCSFTSGAPGSNGVSHAPKARGLPSPSLRIIAGRPSAAGDCVSVIRCGVENDQRRRQSVGAYLRSRGSGETKKPPVPDRVGGACIASCC